MNILRSRLILSRASVLDFSSWFRWELSYWCVSRCIAVRKVFEVQSQSFGWDTIFITNYSRFLLDDFIGS